ncbi:MAG: thioredoxin [Anaerovibrio sp.]|uniref:thioredoxin n=1 Tax=uncultured Anaerovibrio sp. TaxID=361586 RepID=UPI0025FD6FAA|nr:thioredoxin [uncultured Anaerovibrio sp.]MBQ3854224.1 thioredoxin [Anaerovibrio sp.]
MAEVKITKDNFQQEVMESDIPVIVDFWASWCGPCQMMAPILAEIAEENEGSIKIGKVNVDEEPALSAQYGIVSIPSLYVFKNGKVTNQYIGYITKDAVLALLK